MLDLASRFSIYFKSKGETRYAFAKRIGISPSTIDNYLQGDRIPSAEVLTKIFSADPRLSPLWFFSDNDVHPMYLDEISNDDENIYATKTKLVEVEEENRSLKEQIKDKDKIIKMLLEKVG